MNVLVFNKKKQEGFCKTVLCASQQEATMLGMFALALNSSLVFALAAQ